MTALDRSSFGRAAFTQIRVIGALMLRDLVEEGSSSSIPFLSVFIRPVAIVGILYLLGRAAPDFAPQGVPLMVFVVTGYLTWIAFLRGFTGISTRGTLKVLMIPQITPLDLIISKMSVQFVLYTILFVTLCGLGVLFEQAAPPGDPFGVMLAFWSALLIGITAGMTAASISRVTTILDDFLLFIRLTGHLTSGVAALATSTPQVLLDILRWNPLFQAIEWLRESWWPSYKSPIADPGYIALCIFFMMAVGLAAERSTRRFQRE